ncbi:FAD-dependent oxidoreductase [Rheinheimera sp. 1928-s]|uniref:NAD(P)/FAD-dependent oxidoreductase n=1 Tax=Rheinheimera sp. 1928-s TaxID=3033803 RepID=UPI002625913D|nr:FAD-dependent oxidoreductase [Rheinheimera sp. 1928-s]MDF3126189.1 FAD-dependent oxidoreductase [Rheinheimera sp. 1928-s]
MKKIAVIGAGLTGAAAARTLVQQGFLVTVFDKGRSAGGRMSSKRTDQGYLDLGAQYFTARSDVFKQQVQLWLEGGQAEVWPCTTVLLAHEDGLSSLKSSRDEQTRFIGVPSMQSPVKALLQDIALITACRIQKLSYQQQSWSLLSDEGQIYAGFDAVLLTLPPAQAQQLMAQSSLPVRFENTADVLEPCWAVAMQAEASPAGDAIFCQHPKLRFISHQQHKTGRNSCYILHFNAAFSAEHLHKPPEFWFAEARVILSEELKIQQSIEPLVAHRWLYASQNDQVPAPGLITLPDQQLWAGGDWSYGGRLENAYLAGLKLAQAVIHSYKLQQETV